MAGRQNVLKLINENWKTVLAEKVKEKFGDIGLETDYNLISMNYVSVWKKQGVKLDREIQSFISGVEAGCVGIMNLVNKEVK